MIGAERTETDYLDGMRGHLATVRMRLVEKPAAPDQLVEYTRDNFVLSDFDEVWCVTDVDSYEREGGKVTAALALAKKAGINVAVSDPCFEVWLLLHHEDCSAHCANCGAVERKLRKRVLAYDKARLNFRHFAGGLDQAVERARKLEPGRNPSTGVWRLVNAVLERE
ncbi:RloB family protein [Actinoplanes sp. NPDC026619]|uniref:RloB family protein n=1 Tax=Actinoplanes sp. NPDC026619 TaxID=3155798 RepID=UPI0033F831A8